MYYNTGVRQNQWEWPDLAMLLLLHQRCIRSWRHFLKMTISPGNLQTLSINVLKGNSSQATTNAVTLYFALYYSDSSTSELSSTTLDSILSMTELEPAFEGLLQQTMATNAGLPSTELHEISPTTFPIRSGQEQTSLTPTSLVHHFNKTSSSTNTQTMAAATSSSAVAVSKQSQETKSETTSQQLNTLARSEAVSDFTGTALHATQQAGFSGFVEGQRSPMESDKPPAKRAKVMMTDFNNEGGGGFFPTDQDIDDFLDKLHHDSNTNDDSD